MRLTSTPTRRADSSSEPAARSRHPQRGAAQRVLEADDHEDEHEEGDRDGPELRGDRTRDVGVDEAAAVGRRRKLNPWSAMYIVRVAAMAVNFTYRISAPLTSPTTIETASIAAKPNRIDAIGDSSRMKNEPTTTRNPTSGPTERSMPPVSSAIVCPSAMNPSAVTSSSMDEMLNAPR